MINHLSTTLVFDFLDNFAEYVKKYLCMMRLEYESRTEANSQVTTASSLNSCRTNRQNDFSTTVGEITTFLVQKPK